MADSNGMREVARAAGVSVSTVANVLSRPSIVAPETRRRVQQAIDHLGYVPSGPARQLRGVPSPIVGSVTLDLANPFHAEVNRGIEDCLAGAGCLVLACSTDLRPATESRLLHLLQQQNVRGIIISPAGPDPAQLLEVSRRGTPVVLLDHPKGEIDLCAVAVDDGLGGRLAGEHLRELGHRRIAYLGATVDPGPVARRRQGLREAVGTILDVRMDVHPPALGEAAAAAAERIVALQPTAVVCLNDTAALGLLDGLDALGVRVPDDLSVVGYDDLPFARRLAPPLTTVRQPTYRLGFAAAELLLDEGRPGHTHREVRFEPELVVRSSTGPPMH
ncbi:LacI family DNA-binding transcriptional regulator [Paractinoplanes toevensis]|uniref:LacI family transcriptional regulator n=1 Tax=Paractinoplanes toevensis TaxID=571911 RepID=A0A919T5V0_9ACTN|nr:LacI family DNA-binding transcriptional regulator [Actinoplanes toevensis]GIM88932.1 LacI family transcriptional regulator [Actinoplanes toevensis]